MREIKFRGKGNYGEWVYGSLIIEDGKYYIVQSIIEHIKRDDYEIYMIEVDQETVGQYTGLKDKNGVEIYEGDIVRKLVWNEDKYMETNNGECYSYAQIQYIEELAGFYLVNNEGEICWELAQDKYSIEVCSNIYDNLELLKGE